MNFYRTIHWRFSSRQGVPYLDPEKEYLRNKWSSDSRILLTVEPGLFCPPTTLGRRSTSWSPHPLINDPKSKKQILNPSYCGWASRQDFSFTPAFSFEGFVSVRTCRRVERTLSFFCLSGEDDTVVVGGNEVQSCGKGKGSPSPVP